MSVKISEKLKYDPWEAKQEITDLKIVVHCCRYWMLSEWECENMSFPFWRIYHSRTGGSYVSFDGREVELSPSKLILIPPYTSFSTRIKGILPNRNESIKGVKISDINEIDIYKKAGLSDQFFVHFNLDYLFDKIRCGIYEIELTDYWEKEIRIIEQDRLSNQNSINFQSNIKINGLILYALQNLEVSVWAINTIDNRILKVIKYIETNLSTELTNKHLSSIANLATNSFARLFRESLHCSVQQYIQKKRIDAAIILLHYSDIEIDNIASKCGYCDRSHFSKAFKKTTGVAPASYRKKVRAY
jgi:AraC-like DNA-binding protein